MFSIERVAPINNVKFWFTCDMRHRDPSQIKHRNTQQLSTNNDDHSISISISISITHRASTVLIGLVYNNEIHTESDSIKIRKCGIDPTEQSQGSKLSRPGHGPFPQ